MRMLRKKEAKNLYWRFIRYSKNQLRVAWILTIMLQRLHLNVKDDYTNIERVIKEEAIKDFPFCSF
jgi:hypothetical protein